MVLAVADDEQLMRELYDNHAGVVLGYVRRLVDGDTARAEDVVQETLLRAWRHPDALDPNRPGGASVRAWLLTVARHLVIDAERAKKARPREVPAADDAIGPPLAQRARSGDEAFDQILLAHGMGDALVTLTPHPIDRRSPTTWRDLRSSQAAGSGDPRRAQIRKFRRRKRSRVGSSTTI